MNNPPFSIGQKVVCIDDSPGYCDCSVVPTFKKNDILIIEDVEIMFIEEGYKVKVHKHPFHWNQKRFAPIVTNYSDATTEILEKFKSPAETPDKILTPEKVLLNQ